MREDNHTVQKGILFACNMNSIRSPMAEAIARETMSDALTISSAGIYEGGLDPFVEGILAEIDLSLNEHEPQEFGVIDPDKYDLVIALTPEAASEARKYFGAEQIVFWDIPNPTDERGNREQIMEAYRRARDLLQKQIKERFS